MGCPWNLSTFVNSLVYTVYNLLRGLQKTTTWRDCNRLTSYLCFHGYPSNNTSRFLHWRSPQHLGVTVSAACPQHKRPSRETSASPFLPEAWACERRFVGRSNGPNPQEILKLTAKGAENRVGPKRKGLVSQWWFFGGYVSFSECRWRFFLKHWHMEKRFPFEDQFCSKELKPTTTEITVSCFLGKRFVCNSLGPNQNRSSWRKDVDILGRYRSVKRVDIIIDTCSREKGEGQWACDSMDGRNFAPTDMENCVCLYAVFQPSTALFDEIEWGDVSPKRDFL